MILHNQEEESRLLSEDILMEVKTRLVVRGLPDGWLEFVAHTLGQAALGLSLQEILVFDLPTREQWTRVSTSLRAFLISPHGTVVQLEGWFPLGAVASTMRAVHGLEGAQPGHLARIAFRH